MIARFSESFLTNQVRWKFCVISHIAIFTWITKSGDDTDYKILFQKSDLLTPYILKTSIHTIVCQFHKSDMSFKLVISGENSVMIYYVLNLKFDASKPPVCTEFTSIENPLIDSVDSPIHIYKTYYIREFRSLVFLTRKNIYLYTKYESGSKKEKDGYCKF